MLLLLLNKKYVYFSNIRYENSRSPESSVAVDSASEIASNASAKFKICSSSQRYAIEQGETFITIDFYYYNLVPYNSCLNIVDKIFYSQFQIMSWISLANI